MKRTHVVLSIGLISLLLLWTGCKAREAASGNSATGNANTSSNSNQPAAQGASGNAGNANTGRAAESSAAAQTGGPPNLAGTYEWREVEDKGVVTIITKVKTTFVFRPDGGYARMSQLKSKTYHSDSGRFQIEGDKLILAIQISDKNMQTPAVTKTFKFSLSPDGDQLKMTNDKGATATYQRTAKPKA